MPTSRFVAGSPGEWRIRLRGQPARTDVSLYLEETGVVRMEASVRRRLRAAPNAAASRSRLAARRSSASLPVSSYRFRSRLARRLDRRTAPRRHPDAAQVAMRLRAYGRAPRRIHCPRSPLDFDAQLQLRLSLREQQCLKTWPATRPSATAACASPAKNSA